MICTNIEQSKELVRRGLEPSTADMWWSNRFVYWSSTPMIGVATEQNQLYTFKWCEMDVPAWSLSALLELVPKNLLPTLEWRDGENEWEMNVWVDHNIHSISHYDKLIAAYEMVCWLLEQELMKGGQDDNNHQ